MALGTFLAGVVLAESEYRHELESNIEPFKGILLGIFFTAVGSSMQFPLLQERTQEILTLVLILLTAKITFTKLSTKIFKSNPASGWTTSVLLSQGGEFGFVLFGAAVSAGVLTRTQSDELTLAVALSMFTTPLLLKATEKLTKTNEAVSDHQDEEKIENLGEEIIIAGMGRYGQIVARLLLAQNIIPKIIDVSPESLERLRVFGFKVFYGDATEITLLESAGIEQAKVLVIAIDNRESILKVAKAVHSKYPHIKILARAFDLMHVYELMDVGVNDAERETFNAALATGEQTLTAVGFHPFAARRAAKMFREYDIKLFNQLHSVAKQRSEFTSSAVAAREEIVRIFNADRNYIEEGGADTAWSKLDKV
jgi:glutathione-regulated potassium-efflux system ancillary protein KefC